MIHHWFFQSFIIGTKDLVDHVYPSGETMTYDAKLVPVPETDPVCVYRPLSSNTSCVAHHFPALSAGNQEIFVSLIGLFAIVPLFVIESKVMPVAVKSFSMVYIAPVKIVELAPPLGVDTSTESHEI